MGIKVGLVMPDCGDRPVFFERALQYLARQTRQPDYKAIVNQDLGVQGIDLVYRYEKGFRECFNNGCDVVVCMESDDWYSPIYIQTMVDAWEKFNRPVMLGVGSSIYYHISDLRFSVFKHAGRSSMNSMLVTKKVLEHKFDYGDPYLDFRLWEKINGMLTFEVTNPLVVGIKHGQGKVAGSGHVLNWQKYNQTDKNFVWLQSVIGLEDSNFYRLMAVKDNYKISRTKKADNSFLSIITRVHAGHRPKGLDKNLWSVTGLTSNSYEQIFIVDQKGLGRPLANTAFCLAAHEVKGEWVFLLDDDDFIVNDRMIEELQRVVEVHPSTDVIVFRNIIKNGAFNNYYPSPECWEKRRPILAHIGGSCFVCRAGVFRRYVMHFAHSSCGDFHMLDAMYKSGKLNWYWHDSLMMETGVVSRGKTEAELNKK